MKLLNSKSFTLIEILIGSVLVIIIAVALFTTLVVSFNNLRRVMELRTATLVLQEQVSSVRELKFLDIQSLGETFFSEYASSLEGAQGTIGKSPYGGSDKITKVTFRLGWISFDGKPLHKSVVTLMTDHGINKK